MNIKTIMAFAGVVLMGLVQASPASAAAAKTDIELTPVKLSEHAWYFHGESGMASAANKGYMSNAGFVVTKDEVVVFDALGTPALGEAMIAAIGRITPLPIKLVVVSHYHADHFYGLQAFKALGAEVWAHERATHYLNSPVATERLAIRQQDLYPWVNESTRMIAPDKLLSGGMKFSRGGVDFEIIDAHGSHADDDIMLMVRPDGVLFAGDLFFSGRVPFVGDANSAQWLVALDKMLDSKPAIVVPGHGTASSDPRPGMEMTKEYLRYLRAEMGRAVADMQTFDEAYEGTDWSRYQDMPAFEAANRINAYGVFLDMEAAALKGKK